MKREIYYLLTAGLIFLGILFGIYILESGAEANMIKRIIKIEAEAGVLHYQGKYLWDEDSFNEILGTKEEFKTKEIDSFKKRCGKVW